MARTQATWLPFHIFLKTTSMVDTLFWSHILTSKMFWNIYPQCVYTYYIARKIRVHIRWFDKGIGRADTINGAWLMPYQPPDSKTGSQYWPLSHKEQEGSCPVGAGRHGGCLAEKGNQGGGIAPGVCWPVWNIPASPGFGTPPSLGSIFIV